MAKLFPTKQQFVDLRDGSTVSVSKVKLLSSTTDFVSIGPASDVALLQTTKTASDPSFYLSEGNNSILNIDGGTIGTEFIVVARHDGKINLI